MVITPKIRLLAIVLAVVLGSVGAHAALNVALSDQGTNVVDRSTGQFLASGNLTVLVYQVASGGTPIYNESFNDSIINGSWNVMLGETMNLPLEYNRVYFRDYQINGEDVNFTNGSGSQVDRQFFFSPVGDISDGDVNIASNFTLATLNATVNLTVANQNVCLQNGTNCPASIMLNDTLQTITTRGNSTNHSIHIDTDGDETSTVGGNLNVSGTLTIDSASNIVVTNGTVTVSGEVVCLNNGTGCDGVNDTDTQKNASGTFLFNDSTTIFFNETQLNNTIDDRIPASMNESLQNVTDNGNSTTNSIQVDTDGDETSSVGGNLNVSGTVFAGNFSGNSPIVFINGTGAELVRFAEDGQVGIGTTNPGDTLTVQGPSGGNTGVRLVSEASASRFTNFVVFRNTTTQLYSLVTDRDANRGTNLDVHNATGSSLTTWQQSGNVGIGATSPTQKLDVNGSFVVRGDGNITGGLTVSGQNVCLENGTNCAATNGTSNLSKDFALLTLGSDMQGAAVVAVGRQINFTNIVGSGLTLNTTNNTVRLEGGKSYSLEAAVLISADTANGILHTRWFDVTNAQFFGNTGVPLATTVASENSSSQQTARGVISPTTDIDVQFRITALSGGVNIIQDVFTYGYIEQIGGEVSVGAAVGSSNDTLQSISDNGATTTNALTIDSNGDETSLVGGDLNVSGTVFADNFSGNSPVVFINGSGAELVRFADSGRVGVGTTTPSFLVDINGSNDALRVRSTAPEINLQTNSGQIWNFQATGGRVRLFDQTGGGGEVFAALNGSAGTVVMGATSAIATERVQITSDSSNNVPLIVNREPDFGNLISFRQNGTVQGSISMAPNGTVSYNSFTGSHLGWMDDAPSKWYLMELTGDNQYLHGSSDSEIVYGVKVSNKANSKATLGAYLGEYQTDAETDNFHLIAAEGNGRMWVVDTGEDIEIGDYLIASDVAGHAMKDTAQFDVSHVVARIAEPVQWEDVTETVDGKKHVLVSVLFERHRFRN